MSTPTAPGTGMRDVARLALPAIVSYILNSTYRINDQYWIQGLGGEAQAALGASMFVLIMNFAIAFLALGGTLALVSRATGSGRIELRNSLSFQALWLGVALGASMTVFAPGQMTWVTGLLGLEGATATMATEYLATIFLWMVPLMLAPVIDTIVIGMGNTLLPMLLQCLALAINFALNPMLIYGPEASELDLPLAQLAGAGAEFFGIEGHGAAGAGMATGASRAVTSVVGLLCLRFGFGLRLAKSWRPHPRRILEIASISAPVSASIAAYSAVYWLLLRYVVTPLGDDVVAGLGVGFQVFEGVSYPCYVGVSIAGATLVGQCIGANDREAAWRAVRSARRIALLFGIVMTVAFFAASAWVVPLFSESQGVLDEARGYVFVLAFSQVFVAFEAVHEKTLTGAGTTRPALWIGATGNALRVPLAYGLVFLLGAGSLGVWWTINATTLFKSALLYWIVQRGRWLDRAMDHTPAGFEPDAVDCIGSADA